MQKKIGILLVCVCAILTAMNDARAATYFCTQNGSGNKTGSSYDNSMSVATYNAKSNFAPDDLIYLCDTILGVTITPASHGTAGHPVVLSGNCPGHPGVINANNAVEYGIDRSSSSAHDLTFEYLEIKNAQSTGININPGSESAGNNVTNYTIQYCNIHDNGVHQEAGQGIQIYGAGNKILHNTITNVGGDGIYFLGNNMEIAYNTISKVSQYGPEPTGSGDCIQKGSGITSANMWIHHNYLDHSDIDGKSCVIIENGTNPIVEYNTCFGARIALESITSSGDIWRYNSVTNAFQNAIEIDDSSGSWYYNIISGGCGSDGNPGGIQITSSLSSKTVSLYNNVVYNVTGYGITSNSSNSGSTINHKNNIYHTTRGALLQFTSGPAFNSDNNLFYNGPATGAFRYGGSNYNTLASYASAKSKDQHSIAANPLFVSTSDFNLSSSSPAIDAGTNVGLTQDFAGTSVPRGLAPDIGGYEYNSSDTTAPSAPRNLRLQ